MNTASFLELRPSSTTGAVHGDPGFRGSNTRESESPNLGFSHLLDAQSGGPKSRDLQPEYVSANENRNGVTQDVSGKESNLIESEDPAPHFSEGGRPAVENVQSDSGLEMKSYDRQAATDLRELQRPLVSDDSMKRLGSLQVSQQQSTLTSSGSLRPVAMVSQEAKHPEGVPKAGIAVKSKEMRFEGEGMARTGVNVEAKHPEGVPKVGITVSSVGPNAQSGLFRVAPAVVKEASVDSNLGSKSRLMQPSVVSGSPSALATENRRSVSVDGGVREKRSFEHRTSMETAAEKASPSSLVGTANKTGIAKDEGRASAKLISSNAVASKPSANSGVADSIRTEQLEKSTSLKGTQGSELSEKSPSLKNLMGSTKGDSADSGADKVLSSKLRVEGPPAQGLTQQAPSAKNENGKTVVVGDNEEHPSKLPQAAKSSRGGERNANSAPLIHEVERKSESRAVEAMTESRFGEGKNGIGTARAMLGDESDQSTRVAMTKAVQKSDTKPWRQGLSDTAGVQESKGLQVVARVDGAPSASAHGSGMGEQQGRGGNSETYRHYAQEIAESRSNAQAATQSQFMERSVASQLSTAVVNQILNHLEKLRESDRGRVRVQLGNEDSGSLAVQISISGGVVRTVFEGDESVLSQIRSDWQWIQSRASDRGVSLEQPQYLSSSLVSGGASLFPDDAVLTGNQRQSVIQQSENQPVRPEFQTAVSGTSGPVHLYA